MPKIVPQYDYASLKLNDDLTINVADQSLDFIAGTLNKFLFKRNMNNQFKIEKIKKDNKPAIAFLNGEYDASGMFIPTKPQDVTWSKDVFNHLISKLVEEKQIDRDRNIEKKKRRIMQKQQVKPQIEKQKNKIPPHFVHYSPFSPPPNVNKPVNPTGIQEKNISKSPTKK